MSVTFNVDRSAVISHGWFSRQLLQMIYIFLLQIFPFLLQIFPISLFLVLQSCDKDAFEQEWVCVLFLFS